MNTTHFAAAGLGAGRADLQLVTFYLESHQFAVDVDDVFGIYSGVSIIPTPDLGNHIDGELLVCDQRIPVLNLRRFSGLSTTRPDRVPTWILAVNAPGGPVALLVDKVTEVVRLEPRSLNQLPEGLVAPVSEYVSAAANHQGRKLLLVDLRRLLQDALC